MNHPKKPPPYNPDGALEDFRETPDSPPRAIIVRRENGTVYVGYNPNCIGNTLPELIAIAREDAKRIGGRVQIY